MRRHWTKMAAAAALAFALAAGAAAQDRPREGARGPREGRGDGQARAGRPDRPVRETERRQGAAMALRVLHAAAETDEGKAATEAFRQKAEAFREEVRELMAQTRERIQAARREGAEMDALREIVEEGKAAVLEKHKAFVADQIATLKALTAAAEQHKDAIAQQFAEQIAGRIRAGRGQDDADAAERPRMGRREGDADAPRPHRGERRGPRAQRDDADEDANDD